MRIINLIKEYFYPERVPDIDSASHLSNWPIELIYEVAFRVIANEATIPMKEKSMKNFSLSYKIKTIKNTD